MDFKNIDKKEFLYTCGSKKISCHPVEVVLPAGAYRFECYGASGGASGNGMGGYGAYVSGYIKLNTKRRIFLFIGAQGHLTDWQQAFNGGGRYKLYDGGGTGGGSTDIRLINSTELDGLVSRIIVASAGGGGISWHTGGNGGNGGIFSGGDGRVVMSSSTYSITSSKAGSVSNGGNGGRCVTHGSSCHNTYHAYNGGFGFGGDANYHGHGGGGGSGYFGGGGGAVTMHVVGSGAGGSSYVSGYNGFHTFKVENGQLKDTLSEKHSSGLVFYNVYLQSGSVTKYVGDGKVIITRVILINCSCRNPFYYNRYTSKLFPL
jgi:hypothetical protein